MKRDVIKAGEIRGSLKVMSMKQYKPRKYEVKCLRCGKVFMAYPQTITQHSEGCFECREKDLKESTINEYKKYNGEIFGSLKVIGFDGVRNRLRMARCLCLNCDRETSVPYTKLIRGVVKICSACVKKNLEKGIVEVTDLSKGGSNLLAITSDMIKKNNTSGYTGVSQLKSGKYRAYINFQRKQFHLGIFDSPQAASAAYQEAKKKIRKDFIKWYKDTYPDLWDKYKDKVERRQEK
nr:MAG TPA: AP2 domain protein [Caudoviricetes sp.]